MEKSTYTHNQLHAEARRLAKEWRKRRGTAGRLESWEVEVSDNCTRVIAYVRRGEVIYKAGCCVI